MTKHEFLKKLKEALENDLDSGAVQENLSYYRSYIEDEVARGRSESQVLEELGDPWVLARTVIEMAQQGESADGYAGYGTGGSYESGRTGGRSGAGSGTGEDPRVKIHTFTADSRWKRLLTILVVIVIVWAFFAIVGGLISLLAPVIMPVIGIALVIWLIRRLR